MESKLNIRYSDVSFVEETPISQISASSYSLSIPSEPPDLRNWFRSYQYESPALNSSSFLGDSVIHESGRVEKEEISCGFRINGNKDETFGDKEHCPNGVVKSGNFSGSGHENQSLSKIRGSCESASLISEPPDIRNWCSSYVYESPSLDTSDGFGDSTCKESKHDEDGCLVGSSNREEEEKDLREFSINRTDGQTVVHGESLSETQGRLESPLPMSEPMDIKNWFSSYVYESPSVDTTDGFGDTIWIENRSDKDGFLVKESNSEKEDNLEDFSKGRVGDKEAGDLQSEELAKRISSWRDEKQVKPVSESRPIGEVKENLPNQNDLCLNKMPQSLQNHVIASDQDIKISILNKERSQPNLEHEVFYGTGVQPLNNKRSSCSNVEKSPEYMSHNMDFPFQETVKAKCQTERKPSHGGKGREDEGKPTLENGFVTTRKGKVTSKDGENLVEGPQQISKATSPIADGKVAAVKRKALADATNFHHSPVMGITGKWKCPQRSKPNRGPPLKQLGLEKWVRKL